jgi:DNA-binding beta-propeller fold protein YncE
MRKQRMWEKIWFCSIVALLCATVGHAKQACAADTISVGKLTPDVSNLRSPGRLAVDQAGTLYVVDSYKNRVQVIDDKGLLRKTIGIARPSAIAYSPDGPLYIGSHDSYSVAIVKDGEITGYLGASKNEFLSIRDIAVDPAEGDVYVVDTRSNAVRVYTAAGVAKGTLGGFTAPVAVAVSSGEILVLDEPQVTCPKTITVKGEPRACPECTGKCSGSRITALDKTGTPIRSITESGDTNGNMMRPAALATDSHGTIYVADTLRKSILVYDRKLAYQGDVASGQNDLNEPVSLTVSRDDNLYVSEGGTHSIVEVGLSGTLHTAPTGTVTFESRSDAAKISGVPGN